MSNEQVVYNRIQQALKHLLLGQAQKHMVTLAMMISGIVLSQSAQLPKLAEKVPHPSEKSSKVKRFSRFLDNERIDEKVYYMPFISTILASLSSAKLVFVMDSSTVGKGCRALVLCVVYKTRAIPVSWIVYPGKRGHTTGKRHIELLQQALPLVPEGAKVVLLGDGEFDNTELLEWLKEHTSWGYVMRTAKTNTIFLEGEAFKIEELCHSADGESSWTRGVEMLIPRVLFTAKRFGPVNILAWWGEEYESPIYLVTNLTNWDDIKSFYKLRFFIETFFGDIKSRGFHIHQSHLSSPQRLGRLLLAISLAYLWILDLGFFSIEDDEKKLQRLLKRKEQSVFRVGLEYLGELLMYNKPLPVHFDLPRAHGYRQIPLIEWVPVSC